MLALWASHRWRRGLGIDGPYRQPYGASAARVLNYVAETGRANNGVACTLAPWHGIIIFHGQDASGAVSDFGRAYGSQYVPTAMPRQSPQVVCGLRLERDCGLD